MINKYIFIGIYAQIIYYHEDTVKKKKIGDHLFKALYKSASAHTHTGWYVECLSACLTVYTDLYSWLGGVPGLRQSETQRKITEACRTTGATWWQSESYPKETDELQAERCSIG